MSSMGSLARLYAASRINAIRRAYRAVTPVHSPLDGFEGLVEEIRVGTDLLDDEGKARADDAVLTAAFFGGFSVKLIEIFRARFPHATASILSRIAPVGFGFMVGGLTRSGPNENYIPACAFRAHGGDRLCLEVCKAGTERFCAEHAAPIELRPSRHDASCTWTWSAPIANERRDA